MNHLTANEIIEFVSLNELNEVTVDFCAAINGHIRKCEECRKLVNAFQAVYDEFCKIDMNGGFDKYLSDFYLNSEEKDDSVAVALAELGGN